MSKTQQLIAAVLGCFIAGFLLVGNSKEKTNEEREAESMVRATAGMSNMASKKCPVAIKKATGSQAYMGIGSSTETDNSTYVTINWKGQKGDNFKEASCTLHVTLGGISKLVIDGEAIIDKDV
ncbi:MAG: hypothetical protein GQ569_04415 [Methylococcaceae bacterium]|nr:hypothetical protein [Methylococcaceae bacterium]